MSLKVPKANNIQLFKDGYKVLEMIMTAISTNQISSKCKAWKMPSFGISRLLQSYLTLCGQVLAH